MNPVTVFKDVARRANIEDYLVGVKAQARQDAEQSAQTLAARFAAAQALEAQQTDAAFDRDDRQALEAQQAKDAIERTKLTIAGEDARAAATRYASRRNAVTDNMRALESPSAIDEYAALEEMPDLAGPAKTSFAAKEAAKRRAAAVAAYQHAGRTGAVSALDKTYGEFKDLPEAISARADAVEEARRYATQEGRRDQVQARLKAAADAAAEKKSKPVILSAAQERALNNNIMQVKLALTGLAPDDPMREIYQENLDNLQDQKARATRKSTLAPELLAEVSRIFKPSSSKK